MGLDVVRIAANEVQLALKELEACDNIDKLDTIFQRGLDAWEALSNAKQAQLDMFIEDPTDVRDN